MKIKFIKGYKVKQGDGKGAEYAAGQVADFSGVVEETYAAKYIRLGVAVEYDEAAARAADRKTKDDADARAKEASDAAAKVKADADAKTKGQQSGRPGQK